MGVRRDHGRVSAARPPRGLDPTGRAAWRHAAHVLTAIGEPVELCGEPMRAYADACSTAASLRREWKRLGRPVLITGPRGAVRAHPLLAAIDRAERQAAELGDALGLTPVGRMKLSLRVAGGRPQGAASAADRSTPPRRTLAKVTPIRPDSGA
jgi:P27 family predicted phage terminase small subunit